MLSCQAAGMGQSTSYQMQPAAYFKTGSDECRTPGVAVPLAVVEEILLNLPEKDVVLICRLVCRDWKELVDSAAHWRARCRREGLELRDASRPPNDWRQFYFLSKNPRNLLKNARAKGQAKNMKLCYNFVQFTWMHLANAKSFCIRPSLRIIEVAVFFPLQMSMQISNVASVFLEKFNGWKLVENGGDGWKIEENSQPIPNDKIEKMFVTSYEMCLKEQLIDLRKEGYSPAFMDHLQPAIKISDWYAPRRDCGSYYQIRVELLDQKKKPIRTFEPDPVFFEQWNDQQWCQMTHVFKLYGPGVRFIRFTHGGRDTKFWAGWYGIRVINSSVEICPAAER